MQASCLCVTGKRAIAKAVLNPLPRCQSHCYRAERFLTMTQRIATHSYPKAWQEYHSLSLSHFPSDIFTSI